MQSVLLPLATVSVLVLFVVTAFGKVAVALQALPF